MTKATELREFASLLTVASGQIQFDTDIKISGDLITTGNTINITADTLNISDPNITLASGAANSSIADGAGITIDGASATLTWDHSASAMAFNTDLNVNSAGTVAKFSGTGGSGFIAIRDADAGTNVFLGDNGGDFLLQTPGSSYSTKIIVRNAGSVGIGDDFTPGAALTISGDGGLDSTVSTLVLYDNSTTAADNGGSIIFSHDWNNTGGHLGSGPFIKAYKVNSSSSDYSTGLKFGTRKNGIGDSVVGLIIDEDQKVGVGSTLPQHKLDVDGAIATRQVRHSIAPTLNLDFANSKQLDPRITFYRDSIATYYDSKGILRYANVNEPRFDHDPDTGESKGLLIEEARTNLTDKNNRFNDWHGKNRVDFIENAAKSPDGYYNATKVIDAPNGVNARHEFWRNFSAVSGRTYTFSIYAKAEEHTMFNIVWYGDNGVFGGETSFDLDAETITLGPATRGTITHVGDGWYRCEASRVSGATAAGYYGIYMVEESTGDATYVGSNDGGLYFFGAQFEEGAFPTSYVPSDTRFTSRSSEATYYDETGILRTAPTNSPRYGYSSPYATEHWAIVSTLKTKIGSSEPEGRATETGLILENAATNLENYSYNMDTTNHGQFLSAGGSFAITGEVAAPDGSYTASKFVFGAGNDRMDDQHGAHNQGVYTFSMWVKGVAGEVVGMALLNDLGGNVEPYILLTGEWQRISITKTFDSQGTNVRTHGVIIRGAPGVGVYATGDDGGNGTLGTWANYVYVWGMQVEAGFAATSYIPTFGGTATRSADVSSSVAYTRAIDDTSIQGSHFTDFFNRNEGTFFANYYSGPSTFYQGVASISDGTYNNRITLTNDGTAAGTIDAYFIVSENAVNQAAPLIGNPAPNSEHKIIGAYAENDFAGSIDGGAVVTDSSGTIPPAVNQLIIGNDSGKLYPLNKHIKKIAYYDQRLSNAELQALTENN